jgi:signal transduction histidine kinase
MASNSEGKKRRIKKKGPAKRGSEQSQEPGLGNHAQLAPAVSSEETARLAALYDVSRALGSSLKLEEVLTLVMDAVVQLTGAQRGFLMLRDDESGALEMRAARDIDRQSLEREDMQVSNTVLDDVLRTGKGVVTDNAQKDPRFSSRTSVIHYSLRSILCVPLRLRGVTTGAIYVDNKVKAGLFGEDDLELLEAFAATAAMAIENARLYTRTDAALAERIAELETLQRIDRELNTGLDFVRVLELTVEWALSGTHADRVWIAMRPAPEQALQIVAGAGEGAELDVVGLQLEAALEEGRSVMRTLQQGARAMLVNPVVVDGEVIALIGGEREEGSFRSDEMEFLARLADHAGVAISNTRLHRAVRAANEAKSEFVSLVSHELKSPMTSIRGYVDLMRYELAGPITEQQAEFFDRIGANVDRMARMVSDLSDITRVEAGILIVDLEPLPLAKCIEEAAAELKPQVESKQQKIVLEEGEDLPPVRADRARLAQVLANLLSNASKYTDEGGTITIGAAVDGDMARVSVSDTGIGLSEQDLGKLFTKFFRSEDPVVRHEAGSGLGLHVSRRLVELMGGEIGVRSKLGEGSTFWIRLPVASG